MRYPINKSIFVMSRNKKLLLNVEHHIQYRYTHWGMCGGWQYDSLLLLLLFSTSSLFQLLSLPLLLLLGIHQNYTFRETIFCVKMVSFLGRKHEKSLATHGKYYEGKYEMSENARDSLTIYPIDIKKGRRTWLRLFGLLTITSTAIS